MNRFMTVSTDTLKKHLKSASFWIMVLMPFIMVLIGGIISYISYSTKTPDTIAVVTEEKYKKNFQREKKSLVFLLKIFLGFFLAGFHLQKKQTWNPVKNLWIGE